MTSNQPSAFPNLQLNFHRIFETTNVKPVLKLGDFIQTLPNDDLQETTYIVEIIQIRRIDLIEKEMAGKEMITNIILNPNLLLKHQKES